MRRALTLGRGFAALLVLLGLTVGVPWLLVATVGNPYPAEGLSLSGRLTDSAILGLLAVLGWIVWAQLVVCVLVEAVAEIRHGLHSAEWLTNLPGTFAGQQQIARWLVRAMVAALVSTAATQPSVAPPVAAAVDTSSGALKTRPPTEVPKERARTTREVEVERGDTLWSLAEKHLGSGERWREIAELNVGRRMGDGRQFVHAESIQPGWRLLMSAADDSSTSQADTALVQRGDTLWDLSEEAYGKGRRWPRLYAANRDQISDPDMIFPGQVLDVPGRNEPSRQRPPAPMHESPEREDPTSPPSTTPSPRSEQPVPEVPAESDVAKTGDVTDEEEQGPTLLAALTGGGALLGAGVFSLLLVRRRMQYRVRRSGRMVARTPASLAAAEAAVRVGGPDGVVDAEFLDLALRELVAVVRESDGALPDVVAARLSDEQLDLHLASPAPIRVGGSWREDATGLVISRPRSVPATEADALAPYPTLVSLGLDDTGGTWLIDLEAAGIVQLEGEPESVEQLARFIAMELGVNTWSDHVAVTVGEFARELTALSPGRIRVGEGPVLGELLEVVRDVVDSCHITGQDVLAGRADGGAAEAWMPTIAFLHGEWASERELSALKDELDQPPGRKAAALVMIDGDKPFEGAARLTLHHDGWMSIEQLGVKVKANHITPTDAGSVSDLIAHHRSAGDESMSEPLGDRPYEEWSDSAGALTDQHTVPRQGNGSRDSLLPQPDDEYAAAAATTSDDLAVLAPLVPKPVSERILALDPTLDADLAAWLGPDTTRPRIRVLGPVELLVPEEPEGDARTRRAHAAEVVAYLATHPQGATTEQLAYDFGVQERVVHNYISAARQWVGADPGTGASFIPVSTKTEAGRKRGMGVYQAVGVLSDEDLFRRLRVRAQARGAEGMGDLVAALSLVKGRPFDQLRKRGYGWLAEVPLDHQLTAAVVDVAHLVATNSLANGDHETAIWAAETAIQAAPAEEKPKLDLAAGLAARGDHELVKGYMDNEVRARSDDGGVPQDVPERSREVLDRRSQREGGHQLD